MSEHEGETRMSELFQRRYAYPLIVSIDLKIEASNEM